jgi:hypothetical protein
LLEDELGDPIPFGLARDGPSLRGIREECGQLRELSGPIVGWCECP